MTASPTPTDAGAGMPSEEEIARLLMKQFYEQWFAPHRAAYNGSVYWDFVNGESAWKGQAAAILSLIRPAFEAKEREVEHYEAMIKTEQDAAIHWCGEAAKLNESAISAEAKLAQAVEDEREACAVIAETAPDCLMDSTFDGVARAIRARSAARAIAAPGAAVEVS